MARLGLLEGGSGLGGLSHHAGRSAIDVVMQIIVEALYVYTSEFRTSEIASAGFSGIIQQTLVRRSPGLPNLFHRRNLFHRPYIICVAIPCLLVVMGGADSFLPF